MNDFHDLRVTANTGGDLVVSCVKCGQWWPVPDTDDGARVSAIHRIADEHGSEVCP